MACGCLARALFCAAALFAKLQPSVAQSGCSRLPIGSISLPGSPGGTAPISVTPPPSLGTGDFVVEWWLWIGNAAPYAPVVFAFSTTLAVSLSPSGVALWVLGVPVSSTYAPVQTVWQHWAVVRNGTTINLFIAGIAVASQSVAGSANLTAPSLVIGGNGAPDGSSPPPGNLPGLIAEFRVVLNAALYTGSFAPPTQPFDAIQGTALLLHATSPAQLLVDASPAATLVTARAGVSWNSAAPFSCYPSGSLSFSGGIIRAPPTAAPLEKRDWTIEFWASPQSFANSRAFSIGACCTAQMLLSIELQPAGTSAVSMPGGNVFGVWPPLYGSWVHMALVRNGTVIAWYVQGKPVTFGTVSSSTNFSASTASPFYIGGDTTSRAYSGLLSNFRVVVGTALYPVVFSVPVAPLPAVTGTLVLLRAASQTTALVDSSGRGVVVNVTGVSWNASAPAGFGGSLSFSGSTASIASSPASATLGTADFTVEFWVNAQSRTTVRPFSLGVCCTSLLSIELKSAGTSLLVHPSGSATSTYTAVWGTWQHMVVMRLGTRLYWFAQGSLVSAVSTTAATNFSAPVFLGGDNTTARALNGLISNFRVVAGIALYPLAFAPPAMPFDASTPGTTLLLSTNSTAPFVDSSSAANTIVPTSITASTLNPFDINGSLSFTGATSSIITVPPAVAAFDTGDFTLEFFVNAQSSAFSRPFAINATALLAIELATTGTSALCLSTSCVFGSWTAVFGVWHHMAVMRSGAYIVWFVNGKSAAYAAVPPSANFSASSFRIGGDSTPRVFKGLLSNFRVVKAAIFPALPSMNLPMDTVSGTLVHLSAASSSAPLADASGRGIVVDAVGVAWGADSPDQTGGGGSLVFSGSTSSIITIPPAAVQLGTGDFTVEFWIKANVTATVRPFSIGICCTSLLSIELVQLGASRLVLPTGNVVSTYSAVWGVWQHMALVRSNANVTWLVNGAQVAIATLAAGLDFSASAANPCTLGGDTTFRVLNGSISNFRVVASAAAFTPPSHTLPPIAGTTLLLSASNGARPFVDSSGSGVAVSATGVTFSSAGPLDAGPCIAADIITCSQTQSASATQTTSATATATCTSSDSASQSQSASQAATASGSSTSSVTLTESQSQTRTVTDSPSSTDSASQTTSESDTQSPSQTRSGSSTPSQSSTSTVTTSLTQTSSASQSQSSTKMITASTTASETATSSLTVTASGTNTGSLAPTASQSTASTESHFRSPTQAFSPTATSTHITAPAPSLSPSASASQSPSDSLPASASPSQSGPLSASSTGTASSATIQLSTPSQSQSETLRTGTAPSQSPISPTAVGTSSPIPVSSGSETMSTPTRVYVASVSSTGSQANSPSVSPTVLLAGESRSGTPTPSPSSSPVPYALSFAAPTGGGGLNREGALILSDSLPPSILTPMLNRCPGVPQEQAASLACAVSIDAAPGAPQPSLLVAVQPATSLQILCSAAQASTAGGRGVVLPAQVELLPPYASPRFSGSVACTLTGSDGSAMGAAQLPFVVQPSLWPTFDDVVVVSSNGLARSTSGYGPGKTNMTAALLEALATSPAGSGRRLTDSSGGLAAAVSIPSVNLAAVQAVWGGSEIPDGGAANPFALTLFGAAPLVLRSRQQSFVVETVVSLGGWECSGTVVSADGKWLSTIAPTQVQVCGDGSDCSYATLVVANPPAVALVNSASGEVTNVRGAVLACPPFCSGAVAGGIFPLALSATNDTFVPATVDAARGRVAPVDLTTMRASTMVLSSSTGVFYATACSATGLYTDATTGACTNLSDPAYPFCAFGGGDACQACPRGSTCAGGFRAWPHPGYWTPQESSAAVTPCREPGALAKCLGWNAALGAVECGDGYLQGSYLCSACERSFFLFGDGTCAACPVSPSLWTKYSGLFILISAVAGFAVIFFLLLNIAAKAAGLPTRGFVKGILTLVIQLMTILQVLSSVSRDGSTRLPDALRLLYKGVALLQFEGITLPPSCLQGYPFSTDVSIISAGVGLWLVAIAAALLRQALPTGLWRRIIYASATAAVLLHPTAASSALLLLNCRTARLSEAAAATLDGASSPSTSESTSFVTPASLVSVDVLESNPYIPCFGRTHVFAGALAIAALVMYTAAMPALMLVWLWRDAWLAQELARRRAQDSAYSVTSKVPRGSVAPTDESSPGNAPVVVADVAEDPGVAPISFTGQSAPLLQRHEPMLYPFLGGSSYTPEAWFWRHCDLIVVFGLSACNALLPTPRTLVEVGIKLAVSLTLLAGLGLLLSVMKNPYRERWKRVLRVALLLLSAACISINATSRALDLGLGSELLASSIAPGGYVILGLTIVTVSVLVIGFGREVLTQAISAKTKRHTKDASTAGLAAEFIGEPALPTLAARTMSDVHPEVAPDFPSANGSVGLRSGAETLESLAAAAAAFPPHRLSESPEPLPLGPPSSSIRLRFGLGAAASLVLRAVWSRRRQLRTVDRSAVGSAPGAPRAVVRLQQSGGLGAFAGSVQLAAPVDVEPRRLRSIELSRQHAQDTVSGVVASTSQAGVVPRGGYAGRPAVAPVEQQVLAYAGVVQHPAGVGAVAALVRRVTGPGAGARMSRFSGISGDAESHPRSHAGDGGLVATPDLESGGGLPREARPARSGADASTWAPAPSLSPGAGRGGRPGSVQRGPSMAAMSPPRDSLVASVGLVAAASSLLSRQPPATIPRHPRRHSVGPAVAWAPPSPSLPPQSHGGAAEPRGFSAQPALHLGSHWQGSHAPSHSHLSHAASSVGFSDLHRGGDTAASGVHRSRRASFSSLAGHGSAALWATTLHQRAAWAPPAGTGSSPAAYLSRLPGHAVHRRRSSITLQPQPLVPQEREPNPTSPQHPAALQSGR